MDEKMEMPKVEIAGQPATSSAPTAAAPTQAAPVNPLAGYYRQPKIYVQLPSGGKWYEQGTLDVSEDGRYPVYAMTAKDELMYKTPDALMNGAATTEVIKSCIPAIKEPWKMPTLDVDACLVAIRIATYGEKMEVTTRCPACKEEQLYDYMLSDHLDKISAFTFPDQVSIGDLSFQLKPYSYKEVTSKQLQQMEQERIFSIINNEKMSEEEKLDKFGASFIKLTEMTVSVVVHSIKSITSPQGTVTDRQMISDFVQNADKEIFTTLSDHLQSIAKELELKTKKVKCGDCEHEFDVNLTMDQANFFGAKS
jgi:predicted Zn-ribbon and HTH transcriptional regulator